MKNARRLTASLRRLMADRDLTAEHLAATATVSKSFLSAVLRGEKSPTVRTMGKLARALGVDIVELLAALPPAR